MLEGLTKGPRSYCEGNHQRSLANGANALANASSSTLSHQHTKYFSGPNSTPRSTLFSTALAMTGKGTAVAAATAAALELKAPAGASGPLAENTECPQCKRTGRVPMACETKIVRVVAAVYAEAVDSRSLESRLSK